MGSDCILGTFCLKSMGRFKLGLNFTLRKLLRIDSVISVNLYLYRF